MVEWIGEKGTWEKLVQNTLSQAWSYSFYVSFPLLSTWSIQAFFPFCLFFVWLPFLLSFLLVLFTISILKVLWGFRVEVILSDIEVLHHKLNYSTEWRGSDNAVKKNSLLAFGTYQWYCSMKQFFSKVWFS